MATCVYKKSIANKMDLIQSELCNFDVICITDNWLDGRTSDDDKKLKTLNCFEETGQVIIMVEFVFMFVITFFQKEDTILSYQTLSASG